MKLKLELFDFATLYAQVHSHARELCRERGDVELEIIDLSVEPGVSRAEALRVHSFPTLCLLRDGELVAQATGVMGLPVLRRWMDGALAKVGG